MLLFTQIPKCEINRFKPKKVIERARIPQGRTREGAGCSLVTCFWGPAAPLPPQSSPSGCSPRAARGFHSKGGGTALAAQGLHRLSHRLLSPGLPSPLYSITCSAASDPTPTSCPSVTRRLQIQSASTPAKNERNLHVTVEFEKAKEGSSINAQRSGLAPPISERECLRLINLSQRFVSCPDGKAFQFYLLFLSANFFLCIVLSFLLLNLT